MARLTIIGAGFTGLYAAALAAEQGLDVTLAARGLGSLSLLPVRFHSIPESRALASFLGMVTGFEQHPAGHFTLPTGIGAPQQVTLAPASQAGADLVRGISLTIGEIEGLRDFSASMICANLRRAFPKGEFRPLNLPLPSPPHPAATALDIARHFEDEAYRDAVITLWQPLLRGVQRLAVPAILGLDTAEQILAQLSRDLRPAITTVPQWLSEIPTIPPSVAGVRLQNRLLQILENAGVEMILGTAVSGEIDAIRGTAKIFLTPKGARVPFVTDAILLATGGFLHGGLAMTMHGSVRETVFDLVLEDVPREEHFSPEYLQPQPYAALGLRVNGRGQVLRFADELVAENLYAAGTVLAGDPLTSGGRLTHNLNTAYHAIHQIFRAQVLGESA